MVDKTLLATKIAAVRDAVGRIRATLPQDTESFGQDRTAREIVVLNLFVAIQECVAVATHWLADEGLEVPASYGEVFRTLADRGVVGRELAARMAVASGFRNLVAHRYGALDWLRVYQIAREGTDDLLTFCDELAAHAASV